MAPLILLSQHTDQAAAKRWPLALDAMAVQLAIGAFVRTQIDDVGWIDGAGDGEALGRGLGTATYIGPSTTNATKNCPLLFEAIPPKSELGASDSVQVSP